MKLDTAYVASVGIGDEVYTTLFILTVADAFKCVQIKGVNENSWSNHYYVDGEHVFHVNDDGTWEMHTSKGCSTTWTLKKEGRVYYPRVYEVGHVTPDKLKGEHYDALIMDDMVDAFDYAVGSKKDIVPAIREYNRIMQGTKIVEGGNEMHKELYHVILFNKKTEEIDFKEYIPAKSDGDACMLAAQTYGKYDSNIHKVIVKQIEGSEYTLEE